MDDRRVPEGGCIVTLAVFVIAGLLILGILCAAGAVF